MIILGLIQIAQFSPLPAQETNQTRFLAMVRNYLAAYPHPIDSITGFMADSFARRPGPVDTIPDGLAIGTPSINYDKLGKGQYLREVSVDLFFDRDGTHSDSASLVPPTSLAVLDTVPASGIPKVRKSRFRVLRGSDPRFFPRVIWPAVGIAAGITGIISLFYIRSS